MLLGIDYGKKRIGLALGEILPYGAGVVDAADGRKMIIDRISEICQKNEVEKIVIGAPIRSQGEQGTLSSEIDKFGGDLSRKLNIEVVYEPEQFTSVEAESELKSMGKKFSRKSGEVDELAAILILEQYINSIK